MATEIELKLALRPKDVGRIRTLKCLQAFHAGAPHVRCLKSRYYDTPEGELRERRVWLRTRSIDGEWLQTLKSGGGVVGGLHQREETEGPIAGPGPEQAGIPDSKTYAFLRKKAIWNALRPIIDTEFERTVWDLSFEDGSQIEMAMDVGEIRAGGRRRDLCELELELKHGKLEHVFRLARALADEVDIELDNISKANKGILLLNDLPPEPMFAVAAEVNKKASVESAFQACLLNCFGHVQGNLACIMASDDLEGVHQMRVGLRRLRVAMASFARGIPDFSAPDFIGELKWLQSSLGRVRDLDVFLEWILPELAADSIDADFLDRLRETFESRREQERATLCKVLKSRRCRRLFLDVLLWAQCCGWHAGDDQGESEKMSFSTFARKTLRRGDRRLRRVGKDIAALDEKELHALRNRTKRQRYMLEFAGACLKDAHTPYRKALKGLQAALGRTQDHYMASTLVKAIADTSAPETACVSDWYARTKDADMSALKSAWKRFRALDPLGKL